MTPFLIAAVLIAIVLYSFLRKPNYPPGPVNLPVFGYLPFLSKNPHEKFMQLSSKYGDVFSIQLGSYRAVVLCSLQSIKAAFKDDVVSGRPRIPYYLARSEGKGIIFSDGRVWSDTRRFTVRNLKDFGFGKTSFEGLIKDGLKDYLHFIEANEGKALNLRSSISLAIINILWTIVGGDKFSEQESAFGSAIMQKVYENAQENAESNPLEYLPWLSKLGFYKERTARNIKNLHDIKEIMKKVIEEHQATHVDGINDDFVDSYLSEMNRIKDPSSPFKGDEGIRNLVIVLKDLFGAGAETTSSTLLWMILLLVTYPNVQRKVQKEIDSVVNRNQLPSISDRTAMPYTDAVIHETLRYSSLLPLSIPHRSIKSTKLAGYEIPADTIVIANIYQVMHDPKHWEKPMEFHPEHFLLPDGTFHVPDAFVPFSIGKRYCPGENLAKMELFLFISSLLQRFTFEFAPDEPKPSLEPVPGLVYTTQPYRVVFKSRNA